MALRRIRPMAWPLLALPLLALPFTVRSAVPAGPRFAVQVAPGLAAGPLDGQLRVESPTDSGTLVAAAIPLPG